MYALHGGDASATMSFHGGLPPVLTMSHNVTTIHSRVAIFSATHNDDTTEDIEAVQMMLESGNATWEITRCVPVEKGTGKRVALIIGYGGCQCDRF